MDICTIIAKNYVAQARVLTRSFLEHHPAGHCWVLVIDDYEPHIDGDAEPFTILTPDQIGCDEFEEMALRYDVLELSTAVKPWLLAHLLDQGAAAITYLDPDIRIYSSIERLDELAGEHGVVLTPHNTTPLPDDGKRPSQVDILLAGVYNLGYVSLGAGEETDRLLRWWRERLLTDCRVDPLNGYFVDQRWFDLAPGLVADHVVVREPQYNLAYWNLHDRTLAHEGTTYTVDGLPLAFFHFSGFDPEKPDVLSRHQSRLAIAAGSALERICHEYSEELAGAGYGEAKRWPYRLLPSGIEFSRRLRRMHAAAVERGEVSGSPFTPAGCEALMSWLGSHEPGAPPGVSRVLADMYATRADLQEAFPDIHGADREGFLGWGREVGVIDEPVLKLLAPLAQPSTDLVASASGATAQDQAGLTDGMWRAPGWGVNVVGYFRSELGTGEAARQVVSALDARGVPVLPIHGRTIPPNRQGHSYVHLSPAEARYPVNVICMNADMLGEFAAQAGHTFFDDRYTIGLWFWEVELFPDQWASAFDHVDEVWLATEHMVHAVSAVSPVPVLKVTLPVQMQPVMHASRAELDLPEGFMFLFSFDHHSVFERKNPIGTLKAYTRAFAADDGATLVIRSINAASAPEHHARLLAAAADRPDVHIIDGYLSPTARDLVVDACDCYVSLHRAEGFGLTMAEAMYLGKPVIATGYSGNLDFMTERNSFLVEHRLIEIGSGAAPYPPEGRWAEPDLDHAARLMRSVFDRPEEAAARARRGRDDIRRTHSVDAAGEIMGRRLEIIRDRNEDRLTGAAMVEQPARSLQQRVHTGPLFNHRVRMRSVRQLARRLVLRVIKPFTAHQESVNSEVAQLLSVHEATVREIDMTATRRYAALLAELRGDTSTRPLWERLGGLTSSTVALESAMTELQRGIGAVPQLSRQIAELSQRLEQTTTSVQSLEWASRAIPYMDDPPFADIDHAGLGRVQGYRASLNGEGSQGGGYRSFEDTFRGSEELIRDRQRRFLEIVGDRSPVLDLGCGRGEFLDLLAERGLSYLGVDFDEGMVQRCREKGHADVVRADGLAYLEGLDDGSLGAIFCAQVIEHLSYEALVRLLFLARLKLTSDGVFIAETVNPHCAPALKTFWVDPTHQHPIFPEVALQLCRSAGFPAAFVFHPNGTGDVERDRFLQGEYAVVAAPGGVLLPGERSEQEAVARLERKVSAR
jgi:SAM-dependent methyltransferase/glycosyltransferase involved in cell wall biosynthesis